MALLNPVYAFVLPFLFLATVPLAVFAGITTTLAFSVLICRVVVVYLDVALSLVPQSIAGRLKSGRSRRMRHASAIDTTIAAFGTAGISNSPPPTPFIRTRRRRRPSSASLMSAGSATPVSELGLIPSVGAERDYEGVGGWRTGDDEIWTTINSRLELPDRQYARNHHRTPSGGPPTPGEGGYLMMKSRTRSPESKSSIKPSPSPNSSRARTPSGPRISFAGVGSADGYFPLTMSPTAAKKLATHAI